MQIGIVCYPTFGGSGVLATELGKALAQKGHQVHFITYQQYYFRHIIRKSPAFYAVEECRSSSLLPFLF